MVNASSDPRSRLRTVVVLGDREAVARERVLRSIPAIDAPVVLCGEVEAPELAALGRTSTMPVEEMRDGRVLEPGHVYVVPPRAWGVIGDGGLRLVTDPAELDGGNGAAERLLRTLAPLGGDLMVVLCGADPHAQLGVKRVKESGGHSILLLPDGAAASSAFDPGPCDVAVTLDELGPRLAAFDRLSPEALFDDERRAPDAAHEGLRDVLSLVRVRTGHDFTNYKRATLYRRVARRMQAFQTDSIVEYHRHLREDPGELARLLRDFLISVTNFFRDPDAFEVLRQQVIPVMFANHKGSSPVRAWVAGCATGEEAYSIAMLLSEHHARVGGPLPQVFATDIDEPSLAEGRIGRYPESISADVSPERLDHFFDRDGDGYRVRKALRELVLFSPHNVLRDPPFSRLDLVTCRNLLIYLNREAQDRVLNSFHFGLRHDGYLGLGLSETAENATMQFAPVDAKHRIFARRAATSSLGLDAALTSGRWQVPPPVPSGNAVDRALVFGEVHHRVVEHYAPPSVLVTEDLEVVHVSDHAGRFLELGGGEPTRQLLRLVMPALRLDLRSALYAVRQHASRSVSRTVRFDDGGGPRAIELTVKVVELPEAGRGLMLVLFDEQSAEAAEAGTVRSDQAPEIEPVVREIEDDLHRTREQLRTTIEQYETSLEELKASNEELHAINEELRSATEELETSKEEQQSVNEELVTLNQELKTTVDELSRANSDLQNLMSSTDIGVIFLDRNLNIMRFTPRAQQLVNVIASDIGRPLAHLTHRLDYHGLPAAAQGVLSSLRTFEREVESNDGRSHLVRLLPYRSLENRIEGVVVTFVDLTDLRTAEALLSQSEARLGQALRGAPLIALSQDRELHLTWGYLLGHELERRDGTDVDVELFGAEAGARLAAIKRDILRDGAGQRVELAMTIDGSERIFDFRIEAVVRGGEVTGLRSMGFDITPSKVAEQALREADARKDQFLATVSHELRSPLTPMVAALDIQRLARGDLPRMDKARVTMERQVAHMIRLVDDLLDVSRITQDKIALVRNPVRVDELLQQALEAVRPRIDGARQRLTFSPPPPSALVIGDRSRLTQVVANLLINASKYTPADGHIELSAAVDAARGAVVITVRDDGIGIAPELLPRVFDLFVQAREVVGRSDGGLGVGLNLVRRLVELHGGSVQALSDGEGKGTEVRVTLPLMIAAS